MLSPTTVTICVSLSTRNPAVSSPIWTIDRANDSYGLWFSKTVSIVLTRHRLNHSLNSTEFHTLKIQRSAEAARNLTDFAEEGQPQLERRRPREQHAPLDYVPRLAHSL